MKYLFVFILGFISHKVVNYIYDFYVEKAFQSDKCKSIMLSNSGNLSQRFDCTYEEMGQIENLKYLLLRPSPFNDKWIF